MVGFAQLTTRIAIVRTVISSIAERCLAIADPPYVLPSATT
jgi:hypothetical protein